MPAYAGCPGKEAIKRVLIIAWKCQTYWNGVTFIELNPIFYQQYNFSNGCKRLRSCGCTLLCFNYYYKAARQVCKIHAVVDGKNWKDQLNITAFLVHAILLWNFQQQYTVCHLTSPRCQCCPSASNGWRCHSSAIHFMSWLNLRDLLLFSEWEFTFTFATCFRPSVCLSSVCNVRAPYSGGCNFRQFFYSIWYLGHPLTST